MKVRNIKGIALAAVAALTLAACGGSDDAATDTTAAAEAGADYSNLKVAVVYIGVPDDKGWTYQHEQGILQLESELGIEVKRVENVPEGDEAEAVMEELAAGGYNLIFATSFGYGAPMARVAAKHPEGCFQWATGAKFLLTADAGGEFATFGDVPANLGTYFGAAEEARYLSGIAAGKASPSGKIGYVAAFPIPEVIRGINAFTLGAQSVNPKVTTQAIFTGDWALPVKEAEATNSMIAQGVDVVTCHVDSPKVVMETAERAGIFCSGYHCNQSKLAPKGYLTGAEWNWERVYVDMVEAMKAGKVPGNFVRGGLKEGFVRTSAYGPAVSVAAKEKADAVKTAILSGSLSIYKGALKDNKGNVVIPAGTSYTITEPKLESMNYLVEGVIGSTS